MAREKKQSLSANVSCKGNSISKKGSLRSTSENKMNPALPYDYVSAEKYKHVLDRNTNLARENSKLNLKIRQMEKELQQERDRQQEALIEAQRARDRATNELRKALTDGSSICMMMNSMLHSMTEAVCRIDDGAENQRSQYRTSSRSSLCVSNADREFLRRMSIENLHEHHAQMGHLDLSSITEVSERFSTQFRLSFQPKALDTVNNWTSEPEIESRRQSLVSLTTVDQPMAIEPSNAVAEKMEKLKKPRVKKPSSKKDFVYEEIGKPKNRSRSRKSTSKATTDEDNTEQPKVVVEKPKKSKKSSIPKSKKSEAVSSESPKLRRSSRTRTSKENDVSKMAQSTRNSSRSPDESQERISD
ncbi:hypothetical protein HDE_13873 [Halotydeus destructor]|nr:hypothetical protein HDE_13873 [Halotydeus destructor]